MSRYTKTICFNCGEIFLARTSDLDRGYGKYCSRSCSAVAGGLAKADKVDQTGEKNPNWKNGISKDNYHYKLVQKERYPERIKARQICYDAIRRGHLQKGVCDICGNFNVQAHHDDYSKPLEVRWLCPEHHRQYG